MTDKRKPLDVSYMGTGSHIGAGPQTRSAMTQKDTTVSTESEAVAVRDGTVSDEMLVEDAINSALHFITDIDNAHPSVRKLRAAKDGLLASRSVPSEPVAWLSDIAMQIAVEMEAHAALSTTTAAKAEAICEILSSFVPSPASKPEVTESMVERLESERDEARSIVRDIYWMALRYADGRKTYAVSMCNDAVRKGYDGGWLPRKAEGGDPITPDFARDGTEVDGNKPS